MVSGIIETLKGAWIHSNEVGCVYLPKRDNDGNLSGCLVAHVGGLLFCGTPSFRKEAIAAIRTFRTGEIETYYLYCATSRNGATDYSIIITASDVRQRIARHGYL